MRIAIADNCGLKFCQDIMNHWIAKGHEVRYERGASEVLAQWADIYYVEWLDGNLNYLWKIYNGAEGVSRTPDWDNNKKPIIVCRMIDWDVWCGFVPFYEQNYIDFIDKAICIAPHIEKYIREKADYGKKLRLIRPGIDINKWPLKTQKTDGFQLGMVLGDMWWPKNHMGGLDIFTILHKQDARWKLHIRGQHEGGQYWPVMYEHYLDSRGIRDAVTLYSPVADMNQWYEQIDILLHPGMKESFCYAVAEAMAKGIQPVVNHFYGACEPELGGNIWPHWMLYDDHSEALKMFDPNYISKHEPQFYRDYIQEHYPIKKMLRMIDEHVGIA